MNQNISNQLDTLKDKFNTLRQLDGTWKVQEQKEGFTFHTKLNPQSGININRVEIHIKGVEFSKLELYFGQMKSRSLVDPGFEAKEILNDGNIIIAYGKGKSPIIGVDARDAVVASKVYKLAQGETLIVNSSVTHEANPPVAGIQRAEMYFHLIHLKQMNANQVVLLNIAHIDPRGDIPKMLVNKAGANETDAIVKLIEYARAH